MTISDSKFYATNIRNLLLTTDDKYQITVSGYKEEQYFIIVYSVRIMEQYVIVHRDTRFVYQSDTDVR